MEGQNNGPFHAENMRQCEDLYERHRKNRLRLCVVEGKKALFHKWVEVRQLIDASPMIGGHPGGEIAMTLAIIEYMDGSVGEVMPTSIKFLDTQDNMPMGTKKRNK